MLKQLREHKIDQPAVYVSTRPEHGQPILTGFICLRTMQIAHFETKYDAFGFGPDWFIRITGQLLGWMQSKVESAEWNPITEAKSDVLRDAIAETGIEPDLSRIASYVPARPPDAIDWPDCFP